MSTAIKNFLDRLICLKYHAVNQSNKVVDAYICQTRLHHGRPPARTSQQKYGEPAWQLCAGKRSSVEHQQLGAALGRVVMVQGLFWK